MGFLQIGKKKNKKSSDQRLMIQSSSKAKSSSSLSTSSSTPVSPVDDFGTSDTLVPKRKVGIFRTSFTRRASSNPSRFLFKEKEPRRSSALVATSTIPEASTTVNNTTVDDYKIPPTEGDDDDQGAHTPARRVSFLSSLRVLPASDIAAADDTSTSHYDLNLDDVEVRQEEDDYHYSPAHRRTAGYDDEDDDLNNESYEIIMSHLDDTPVMGNRTERTDLQELPNSGADVYAAAVITPEPVSPETATLTEPTKATKNVRVDVDDVDDDDEEEPFDAKADLRRFQELSEDPTISDLEAKENDWPTSTELHDLQLQETHPDDPVQQQQEPNLVTPDNSNNTNDPKIKNDEHVKEQGLYKTILETPTHSIRRRLIDAFNCVSPGDDTISVVSGTGTTVPYHHLSSQSQRKIAMMDFFYDTVCGVPDVTTMTKKRPFYNEQFALEFLRVCCGHWLGVC
jgi:hypothetical protein